MRTIFAMGGGGFTTRSGDPALEELILGLARRTVPRVCFLPTAGGDPREQISRFYEVFSGLPCETEHLSLFRLGHRHVDLRRLLLGQDVVYVGGGSMRNMLAVWRVHGLDAIMRECWARGVVLAGLSAGAMCWFDAGVTKSTGRAEPVEGLGLLPGSLSVHHDSEPERRPAFLSAVASGRVPPGYSLADGVGLLWRDRRLERVVSARPRGRCVRVRRVDDLAVEEPVRVEVLAGERERRVSADVQELRALRYGAALGR